VKTALHSLLSSHTPFHYMIITTHKFVLLTFCFNIWLHLYQFQSTFWHSYLIFHICYLFYTYKFLLYMHFWDPKYVHCHLMYTCVNKNPSAWNFLSPKPEVTCGTDAIIIQVVLLSPYLRIRAVSLSSMHYNHSHRIYINRRRQYICLIWN